MILQRIFHVLCPMSRKSNFWCKGVDNLSWIVQVSCNGSIFHLSFDISYWNHWYFEPLNLSFDHHFLPYEPWKLYPFAHLSCLEEEVLAQVKVGGRAFQKRTPWDYV